MPSDELSIKDQLIAVSAEVDQAQAMIDEGRKKFSDDPAFPLAADKAQFELDVRKEQIKIMSFIEDITDQM